MKALVTGASTGIGYATALRLARDGYDVVATMRNPSASDLGEKGLQVMALDVTSDENVAEVFKAVGELDVLVNNAGISKGLVVEEAPIDDFVEAMDTNFFGAIRCTKAVLPSMRERGSGCIVNVSSQAGRLAAPSMAPYNASKWALEGAMETLAAEVGKFGIRVVLIEPGAIITPIMQKGGRRPPDSPYEHVYANIGALLIHDFSRGSAAEGVADCIAESIATDDYRLRWLVGQGAERNIAVREAMSDEESVAAWSLATDELMRKLIPAEEAG